MKCFPDSKNVPVCVFLLCSFWKEPTTEVVLRKVCSMVVDFDRASDLLLTSYAISLNLADILAKYNWQDCSWS